MRFSEYLWEHTTGSIKPLVWMIGGATSLIFMGIILWLIDWSQMSDIVWNISIPALGLGMLVLTAEGVFTALRMRTFTPGSPRLIDCFELIAWFIVLLIVLPARLGEVAVIFLMGHFLGQDKSSALISAFTQRLLDLVVLASFFMVIVFSFSKAPNASALVSIALALCVLVVGLLVVMKPLLLALTKRFEEPDEATSLKARIIQSLHLAAGWYETNITLVVLLKGGALTVGKWICNIGGIALLLRAFNTPLPHIDTLFLAASYNFFGIIPVQSVGGFGISEAGLAGLLVLFGMDVNYSASISILTRACLIINILMFWLVVVCIARFVRRSRT